MAGSRSWPRWWLLAGLVWVAIVGLGGFDPQLGIARFDLNPFLSPPAVAESIPPQSGPRPHPLPPFLAQWQDPHARGDYFDHIEPSEAGYLVWSQFPIAVYIDPPKPTLGGFAATQAATWQQAIDQAIAAWHPYIPLTVVETAATADIRIWRSAPPIQRNPDGSLARIRAAETRYNLYIQPQPNGTRLLRHRFDIYLSPHQPAVYTQATARHELGHALGIWGHSPDPGDVLYYAQVRQPPPISARDLNTLKRIYEQPTCLGWPID
ncbi:matrixin family metalloprotease [Trichothermofontia sp.]